MAFASMIGRPPTHFITIHWYKADGGGDADRRFARFRVLAQKWLYRKKSPKKTRHPLTCGWVLEAPKGEIHSHMAIHIPMGLEKEFIAKLPSWVGGNVIPGTIDVRPITDNGWQKYVLKGVGPVGWDHFNISKHRRDAQGKIEGKRCGISQNIGPAARKRWNDRMAMYAKKESA